MSRIVVPAQHGAAFLLRKGDVLTVIDVEGGQVADLFCFDRDDPLDALSSGRSIDYCETIAFTTGHALHSNAGHVLLRIVEDTCKTHDFLVTPCSLQMFQMLTRSDAYHPSCLENLESSLASFGIGPGRITTTFNAFMNVPVAANGAIRVEAPTSRPGDHIAFEAARDVIVGLTACSDEQSNGGRCKPVAYDIARAPATADTELEDANRAFHDSYEVSRRSENNAPLLVLLGNELVVFRRGERVSYVVIPPAFHAIKTVAHLMIAAALAKDDGAALRMRIVKARALLSSTDIGSEALTDSLDVLGKAEATLDGRDRDMRSAGESILRLTRHATRIQLGLLHAKADEIFATFDAHESTSCEVVVGGDHQARARSLGVQYFARRFGEREGDDERVVYGEGVTTDQQARDLVASRRLDRKLARAFFGDEKRLQRDVLGDATKAELDAVYAPRQ